MMMASEANLRCVYPSVRNSRRQELARGIRCDAGPASRRSGRLDGPCEAVVLCACIKNVSMPYRPNMNNDDYTANNNKDDDADADDADSITP